MQIQPVNIIQSIFVFQAAFGVLLIWKNFRYRGLVYLLLLAMASMIFNLLEETAGTRDWYLITPIFVLARGPFFYLFIYRLVYPDLTSNKQYLFHSLPMLIVLPLTHWPQLVIAVGSISQLIYALVSVKLVFKYHKASFSNRSDAESLQLNWAVNVFGMFLILGLFDLLRLNLQPYISLIINLNGQLIENAGSLLLFSFLIFKASQHSSLFDGLSGFESLERQGEKDESSDSDSFLQEICDSLENLIKTNSLHHRPRLSLNDLAEETGLNSRDISRAINTITKVSFCDYINQLRIADLKEHLSKQHKEKVNLLALSIQYGFNSKSTFNSVFKREIGMTPTQYLKSL